MSRSKWLLEKDVFHDGTHEKMIDILKAKGIEHKIIGVMPFVRDSFVSVGPDGHSRVIHRHNMPFEDSDCVVVYGSINLCGRLMQDTRWAPTAWFNLENMRCASYYAHWGEFMLQSEYAMMPFADFRRKKDFLYSALGADDCIFVRPDGNLKLFSGTVVKKEKFDQWFSMTDDCYCPNPDDIVVVARPRGIANEWRLVVRKGEVVTGSLYKTDGKLNPSPEVSRGALDLANVILKHAWQPEPIFVMDICETTAGEFRLLEIGEVNCAGLYACDLEKVVDAMSAQAEGDWKEVHEG